MTDFKRAIALIGLLVCFLSLCGTTIEDSSSFVNFVKSRQQIAIQWRDLGEPDSALAVFEAIVREWPHPPQTDEDRVALGWMYVHRGYIRSSLQSRYLSAKDEYLHALDWFQQANYENLHVAIHLYQPLGNIYTRLNANERAIQLLEQFLVISLEAKAQETAAEAYNDLALAFWNKNSFEQALSYVQKGLVLPELSQRRLGLLRSTQARIYLASGDHVQALREIHKSSAYFNSALKDPNESSTVLYRYLLGNTQIELRCLGHLKAEPLLNPALERAAVYTKKAYHKAWNRKSIKTHLAAGEAFLQAGRADLALNHFQEALRMTLPHTPLPDPSSVPPVDSLYSETLIREAVQGKINCFEAQYDQTNDVAPLHYAWKQYVFLLQLEARNRRQLLTREGHYFHLNTWHSITEGAIQTALKLHQIDSNPEWVQHALAYGESTKGLLLEKSRNRLFWTHLQANDPKSAKQLTALENRLAEFRIAQASGAALPFDKKEYYQLQNETTVLHQKLKDFQITPSSRSQFGLESFYEEMKTWSETQQSSILSAFEGDKNWYLFLLNTSSVEYQVIPRSDSLEAYLNLHQQFLKDPAVRVDSFYHVNRQLYHWILAPFDNCWKSVQTLLVIPDGDFNRVNLEVLCQSGGDSNSYKTLAYFLREHALSYSPSFKFLHQDISDVQYKEELLAFIPLFHSDRALHTPAPIDLLGRWKKAGIPVKVLLGKEASKNSFVHVAGRAKIVHLYTHAAASPRVEDGWLALEGSAVEASYQKLYFGEIFGLQIPAELLVLQACESADGRVQAGEGVLSIAYGFAAAGSKNILSGRWKMNTSSSSSVLAGFYDHVFEGATLPASLQRAKLHYLEDAGHDEWSSHPYFWSGLQLTGGKGQLYTANREFLWLYGLLLVIVLAGLTLGLLRYYSGK